MGQTFEATYKGKTYILRLRTCEDGYISGWQRSAVFALIQTAKRYDDLLADEENANRVFNVILEEGRTGMVQVKNESAIPVPWHSWLELSYKVLFEILEAFFFSLNEKIEKLQNVGNDMKDFLKAGEQLARLSRES